MKISGYATIISPEQPVVEFDSVQCAHCQYITLIQSRNDIAEKLGFCLMCMQHLCGPCADLGTCTPFEKQIEAEEKACYQREQFAKIAGLQ